MLQECKATRYHGAWRSDDECRADVVIKLLNYHWVLLGPANIFKVSYVNKPSPQELRNLSSCRRRRSAGKRTQDQRARGRACSGACRRSSPRRSCKRKYPTTPRRGEALCRDGHSSSPSRLACRPAEPVACAGGIELVWNTAPRARARGTRVGGDAPPARPGAWRHGARMRGDSSRNVALLVLKGFPEDEWKLICGLTPLASED